MGRFWEEFSVGEVLVTGRRTIDGGDVSRFAGLTGDFNPLHVDAEFAKTTPFGERVAHGILTLAVSNGQQNLGGWFEGTTLALLGLDLLKFTTPVKFGDTIRTELTRRRCARCSIRIRRCATRTPATAGRRCTSRATSGRWR